VREPRWTLSDVPDQRGRVAVVTGGNTGIGFETARALAARRANVVIACRDPTKGERAAARIAAEGVERTVVRVVRLDLASLASVREAAEDVLSTCARLDLLINNAGVMAIPFRLSEDGVELTFATNHLGHFALTGLLLGRLLVTNGSRVITVSSNAHRRGTPSFDRRSSAKTHEPGAAYDRSKLANLLFAFELQRRLEGVGAATIAVAAHPGNARTELWRTSSWFERALLGPRLRTVTGWLAQSAEAAARPTLRAATDRAVRGGDYYGPRGAFGYTGEPVRVEASAQAHDRVAQRRLWELSEGLSGVTYPFPPHGGV
jgi:NAD(P)-dependent dehydrogenase (short-subunit alcohol dehydrogenase family)